MLRTEGISVSFGGVQALKDVGFEVNEAMVTGLIGPNGAGKTTLFNVITGLQRPSRGRVMLDDMDITSCGTRARALMGIGRTFQRLEVFTSLSVIDNVMVALEAARGRTPRRARRGRAREILDQVGLGAKSDVPAGMLPTGSARLLELARALAAAPKILLLDEVSSGLDSYESKKVARLIAQVAADGIAVLMVEHDIEMVMSICTTLHVLDFGKLIATGTPSEIQKDPLVQAAYLGIEDPDHWGPLHDIEAAS